MHEEFLPNASEPPTSEVDRQASTTQDRAKKFATGMVIGSRKGIASVIKTLHHLRQTVSE